MRLAPSVPARADTAAERGNMRTRVIGVVWILPALILAGSCAEREAVPPQTAPATIHPQPFVQPLQASVTESGIHVRVHRNQLPTAGVAVRLRFGSGDELKGVTDRLGSLTLTPSTDIVFRNAGSASAELLAGEDSLRLDLAPLVEVVKTRDQEIWEQMVRERDERSARVDRAITFVGPIYRDLNPEPLTEDCKPSGSEQCLDGIDNDCDGRYDDTSCGYESGVLQWTVIWKGDADLDLHVVGPDQADVWAEHRQNAKLALALDRSCKGTMEGKADCPEGNVENAFVRADAEPVSGTYQAWIEVNDPGSSLRKVPIIARFSGRIGSNQWHMNVRLAPVVGASYQVAFPIGADEDHDNVPDAHDACQGQPGCWFDDLRYRGCADADRDAVPDAIDACPKKAGLDSSDPKKHGCPLVFGDAWVTNEGVEIQSKIEFEFGSAELRPESKKTIKNVFDAIQARPGLVEQIAIDGHTDDVGEEADNIVLSHDRAYAVWKELVQLGLPEEALSSRGFGETKPLANNQSVEGRQKNRRVEFLVLKPKGTVSTCW